VRPLKSRRLFSWLVLATPAMAPTEVPPGGPNADGGGVGLGRGLAPPGPSGPALPLALPTAPPAPSASPASPAPQG